MADQENKRPNDTQAKPPTTRSDQTVPDVVEENLHGTGEPLTTELPTANAPDPTAVNAEDNPNAVAPKVGQKDKPESPSDQAVKAGVEAGKKPAAKKEKPPALEDKPFEEFVRDNYLPALKKGLETVGATPLELVFEKRKVPVKGYEGTECWQIVGKWNPSKQAREFGIFFFDESINGLKGFSCAEGKRLSTMESFLIDERKVTLDLLVFGAVQRLNGQKWLTRN
jgi:Protein of unknown function (DUF2996)